MDEQIPPIIIKKRKKNNSAGHHGGSWKVAYADFVTAMMAFFLLLWLITMASPEKRLSMSEYFKSFNVFREQSASGKSFMNKSSNVFDQSGGIGGKMSARGLSQGSLTSEGLAKKLKMAIDQKLRAVRDQVLVDIVEGGVRIQIVDIEGSEMFSLGSDQPTERAKEILRLVAENIGDIPSRIAIEGHTDAAPFQSARTSNWELSTARASAARREIENNGIEPSRIARVVGYADQELLIKENPHDPKNRRISIILVQTNQ
jgi:chemotaxis protein MotB